ncbi:3-phosphoshikimate 1-carboxyvinyltransferase [Acetatifactor muris]|uniref:3-phosphoshikimate 1-carboxyvinyltransferase n=1 Tax=Acetatifactor muris TaxID=879566 RepID=A0A2K4ZHH0_9FIRM|nr:3-phosphoshikimate 1-carboxyvinyltransferase [Acetatifactor muris]SOY29901.1 3-phosphoshikimate 1-carboxyvinyltransferase [Acetatifactor muris]
MSDMETLKANLISLAGKLKYEYRAATILFILAMLLLAALLVLVKPGKRTKYRFVRLSLGNLLIHLMDGFVTFVNTPTLDMEGNILVRRFGFGWEALFTANLISFLLIVLMAWYFNRYEYERIPSRSPFDYYMKLFYGENYKRSWFWYKFSRNFRPKLAMLSCGIYWGLTAGAPVFVLGWLRHMLRIQRPSWWHDTWISCFLGITVAYLSILKWVWTGYRLSINVPDNAYSVPYIYPSIQSGPVPSAGPLTVSVPGSKSITNRALLLATLAEGTSCLRGALFSDDSRHFLQCIRDLGFEAEADEDNCRIVVKGLGGRIPRQEAKQYVGSAGTAARFLTACLGLSHGVYHMDASEQMRRRPMAPLLDALEELGCEIIYEAGSARGHFPFTLRAHGFRRDRISVNIDSSSQFLSALLIVSCLCDRDFTIQIEGTHGMAYIEMTRRMMEQFHVRAQETTERTFLTKAGQHYRAMDYQIEPDVSAACYFYAMSPLLNLPVLVNHVHFDSLQGDVAFIEILIKMGCSAEDTPQGILVTPPADGVFHGVVEDMSACSDQAITLAAIAPFADSPTTITGIGHIRFQESDRIRAIVTELTKMGISCRRTDDSITIYPGMPRASRVETYDDHRMAMGFSLVGLRSPGIVIDNPGCCRKTFENYFEVLDKVVAQFLHG